MTRGGLGETSKVRLAIAVTLALLAPGAGAQGQSSAAGRLAEARAHHTSTRLVDGRVLVIGGRGRDATEPLASTELFDPRTGAWRRGPPMMTARSGHTATLLDDGRVLVVGGAAMAHDGSARLEALASAEVLELGTMTWREVGGLGEPRNGHSATKLRDGTVLVVGGAKPVHRHLASVERFDPVTGRFAVVRPLDQGRWLHDAVRLPDGTVVVLGGRSNQALGEGGGDPPRGGLPLDTAEQFDPTTGEWAALPRLTEPRQRTAVVALGRRVLVFGGQTPAMTTNAVEWWEAPATRWAQPATQLPSPLAGHTASVLPTGDVLIVGGEPSEGVDTGAVNRWDAVRQRWCQAGRLRVSRKGHAATVLHDGSVLISGGTSGGLTEPTAERWRPTRGPCREPSGP
ncbi:MAG: hypothetical protein INH41_07800 [Myxococcaceae bacterium]|nr:hypothetical protein [Myxococcaceae bacterium]MCA3012287.1 hypothetical protein [Myxococcaceae bacterium]